MYFFGFGFASEMFMRTCKEGFDRIGMKWWRFCLDQIRFVKKIRHVSRSVKKIKPMRKVLMELVM